MREFTVSDLFTRNSSIVNSRTAIVAGDDKLTYGELLYSCDDLASRLTAGNIEPGDRIAVLAMNHPLFFTLVGAVARMGAVLVPLNWRVADEELRFILDDSGTKLLLCDHNFLEKSQNITENSTAQLCSFSQIEEIFSQVEAGPRHQVRGDSPFCIIYTAAV